MNEKIEAIKLDLENDSLKKLQQFISFRTKEKMAVQELEKILGLSRAMAIAVACSFLAGELKNVKAKTNEKI